MIKWKFLLIYLPNFIIAHVGHSDLACIYRPPQTYLRQTLWDQLQSKLKILYLPLCTIGKFNVLLSASDKHGGSAPSSIALNRLKNFMHYLNLVVLSYLVY